jgi:opacity protein-like surface antigen
MKVKFEGLPALENNTVYGLTDTLAYRIDRQIKLQLESGFYYDRMNIGGITAREIDIPLLFGVNFCLPLGKNDMLELHLTPTVGALFILTRIDFLGRDSDVAFACGVGLGLTFHPGKRVLIDVSYRYLRVRKTELYGVEIPWGNAHAFTTSVGFKF